MSNDPVFLEIQENMLGKKMLWAQSSLGAHHVQDKLTDFASWALAESETTAPPVQLNTTLNCWEMILLAAYNRGVLCWQDIHTVYKNGLSIKEKEIRRALLIGLMTKGSPAPYDISTKTPRLSCGDVVFFGDTSHVALATGSSDDIYSFYRLREDSAPPYAGMVEATTITEWHRWMSEHWAFGYKVIKVEYSAPAWRQ